MNLFFGKVFKVSFLIGCLLWVILLCPETKAQEKRTVQDAGWLQQINAKFKAFAETQNPDKVYLHTDRTFYVAGDTIWYKAYLMDAYIWKPREAQEVINVSIFNAAQKEIAKQKVLAKGGHAVAQLILPDSLPSGNFTMVAYTNWMQNAGEMFFFRKAITILNAYARPENASRLNAQTPENKLVDLQFYPEGGNLVNGVASVVGFSARNEAGIGVPVEGKIVDGTGKLVTVFKAYHAGIGNFVFKSEAHKTYYAVINSLGSEPKRFDLPVAQEKGVVLHIDNASDNTVTVRVTGTPEMANSRQVLLVQSRGAVRFSEEVLLNSNAEAEVKLVKAAFPDGITHATLFNAEGVPEAERLFFIKNRQQLNLKLTTGKQTYGRREAVTVNLEATDNTGKPVRSRVFYCRCRYGAERFLKL